MTPSPGVFLQTGLQLCCYHTFMVTSWACAQGPVTVWGWGDDNEDNIQVQRQASRGRMCTQGKSVALHSLSREHQRSKSRGAGAPHCPQELNLISRDPDSEAGAGSRIGVGLNRLHRLRREHFHTCARSQPRADLELTPGMCSLQCPWGLTCSPQD